MIIGVDIGGTKMRAISFCGRKIGKSLETKTPQNQEKFAKEIKRIVLAVAGKRKVSKIGIGVAGVIDGSKIIFSPNISNIKNFDFKKLWPASVLIKVDNDARCFASGEYLFGAGKGIKSVFIVTIGTGIGRAYGKNGKIQKIKKFEYPEPWEKEYQRKRSSSNLILAEFLGKKLKPIISSLSPKVVIIGGGVIKRKGFLGEIRKSLVENGISSKIINPRLKNNSAAIGAATLFK